MPLLIQFATYWSDMEQATRGITISWIVTVELKFIILEQRLQSIRVALYTKCSYCQQALYMCSRKSA